MSPGSPPAGPRLPEEDLGVTPTPPPYPSAATLEWWDESARPTRAPSPADATYSRLGRAIGGHLIEVHDHLRRELTQLLDLIEQLRAGRIDGGQARSFVHRMTIRQNSWTVGAYCASYCRVVTQHHGMEDAAVFPHLRSRDTDLGPVLDRLAEEHLVIHGLLEDLDVAFVGFLTDSSDFAAIDRAGDALDKTLLSHLAYEEAQLVEPLARHGFFPGQVG